jgi:hypothetical protein
MRFQSNPDVDLKSLVTRLTEHYQNCAARAIIIGKNEKIKD